MQKSIARVVCAIGRSGQLGFQGRVPWEGNRSPEYIADVARFFEITRGHVLLAGPKTIASVPEFARADRELFVVRSNMEPEATLKQFAGRIVFIAAVRRCGTLTCASSPTGTSRGSPNDGPGGPLVQSKMAYRKRLGLPRAFHAPQHIDSPATSILRLRDRRACLGRGPNLFTELDGTCSTLMPRSFREMRGLIIPTADFVAVLCAACLAPCI